MGNFYVNLTARTTDREEIGSLLAGRDALISPVLNGNLVVVYDKEADYQAWPLIEALAEEISRRLATTVFVVLNHDDDVLVCALYDRGEQTDLYNSNPDFFEDRTTVIHLPIAATAISCKPLARRLRLSLSDITI